jgi:hypothetical protein
MPKLVFSVAINRPNDPIRVRLAPVSTGSP